MLPLNYLSLALALAGGKSAAPLPVTPMLGAASHAQTDTATFAGGCFWSMERPFDHTPGVISTVVGYTGGNKGNPSYEDVGTRTTGHAESVEVHYDPAKVTYEKLLYIYWHNIDPTQKEAQFCDHGNEYRSAIFYRNDSQRKLAEASRAELVQSGLFKSPIVTEVVAASAFWKAEDYHQHYADKNPVQYNLYRIGCGRDGRLKQIWGSSAEPNVP
ncbi:MAG: peptide-methionine (S)-S-oxide reductase MsrA [Gemmatimonadota bacterium]|nr:peptide-methionine (S)-S-oxide reductase MsrA [Gemmatimonadota bacterium]